MYIVKMNAPENPTDGRDLIDDIEFRRKDSSVIIDRRYLLYKEMVENEDMHISISNFLLTFKFKDELAAIWISKAFKGTLTND